MAKADKICATTSRSRGSIETVMGAWWGPGASSASNWLCNKLRGHEMLMTSGDAPRDQCPIPLTYTRRASVQSPIKTSRWRRLSAEQATPASSPARAVGQPFQADLVVAGEDLVAGLTGDAELAAQHCHLFPVQQPGDELQLLIRSMRACTRSPALSVPADATILNRNGMQVAVVSDGKAATCFSQCRRAGSRQGKSRRCALRAGRSPRAAIRASLQAGRVAAAARRRGR
jgi:hypothetical protein